MTVAVDSHPQKGAIKFKSLKKQPFRGVLTSEKIFWKYAANLQNTHAKVWFQ